MIKKGFSYIGIYFLHLLSLLPLRLLFGLSTLMYVLVYHVFKYRRKVVHKNLSLSFPDKSDAEISAIEQRFYRYFTDLMVEVLKLSSISKASLMKRVKLKNFEMVDAYLAKGESALACSGHYGNWEMGIIAAGMHFSAKSNVIYKPINNKPFEQWFTKLRTRFGNILVPMRQTLRQVVATKNEITVFCFASDQSPVRSEVQYTLNFMNQPTPVLMGLEKIAKQTNRPVFYFDIRRTRRGYYEITCIPLALDPSKTAEHEITELFFEHLTQSIHQAPEYWLWSHNRWKLNDC